MIIYCLRKYFWRGGKRVQTARFRYRKQIVKRGFLYPIMSQALSLYIYFIYYVDALLSHLSSYLKNGKTNLLVISNSINWRKQKNNKDSFFYIHMYLISINDPILKINQSSSHKDKSIISLFRSPLIFKSHKFST